VGGLALVRRDISYGTSHFRFEKIARLRDQTCRFIIWEHSRHQMKCSIELINHPMLFKDNASSANIGQA
jgi:hypothetical protein